MNWRPFAAPTLQVMDVDGKSVQLKDYQREERAAGLLPGRSVRTLRRSAEVHKRPNGGLRSPKYGVLSCSTAPAKLKESTTLDKVYVTFLSEKNHENARRFASYDDFEEIELHSTILIDKRGSVRWKRTGGDPFMDMDFLVNELKGSTLQARSRHPTGNNGLMSFLESQSHAWDVAHWEFSLVFEDLADG